MRSMTGFGAGSAPLGSGRISLEIRALNHKHQEVRVRLPAELQEHTFFLEQLARDALGRGRFDVAVRIEGAAAAQATINEPRLRALYVSLMSVAKEFDPDASIDIAQLLTIPEMLKIEGPQLEETRTSMKAALREAVAALTLMQEAEGRTLKNDLTTRLNHLRQLTKQVTAGAVDLVEYRRQKLKERLDQLLLDASAVSAERIEHEIALLADRSDITEELVRLQSHFDQFSELLDDPLQMGRRLDFLLQEMSREVNTLGAKSPHTKVVQLVVEMKSEVERLREQVQNVA